MTDDLRYERLIAAAPDVVYAAFTSPEGQAAFYGNDDPGWIVDSTCDLRVGGFWTITFGPATERLNRHAHRFRLVDPPRRLLMETTEDRVDGSRLVFDTTFTFTARGDGTLMTMIQSGLPIGELRDEHARGVPNAFDLLARFIAG
jgi:uncharacterized protein YndB with AHSA1/START domain